MEQICRVEHPITSIFTHQLQVWTASFGTWIRRRDTSELCMMMKGSMRQPQNTVKLLWQSWRWGGHEDKRSTLCTVQCQVHFTWSHISGEVTWQTLLGQIISVLQTLKTCFEVRYTSALCAFGSQHNTVHCKSTWSADLLCEGWTCSLGEVRAGGWREIWTMSVFF